MQTHAGKAEALAAGDQSREAWDCACRGCNIPRAILFWSKTYPSFGHGLQFVFLVWIPIWQNHELATQI